MIKAIALDDEPLALQIIEHLCKESGEVELLSTFSSPKAAKQFLDENAVDLILLDIQMPDISGIEFFKSIDKDMLVIFTTAYSEYAVEGFNVNAVDYLLKPFGQDRFNLAIDKVKQFSSLHDFKKTKESNFIQVKSAYSLVNINLNEVILIEGLDDYIKIHLPNKKFVVTRITMKKMADSLQGKPFVRIHRSYIVPIDKISSVRNKHIQIENFNLPIGASYEENFFEQFNQSSSTI
jgi:DNA-binding LytR/AlgR family response regulator